MFPFVIYSVKVCGFFWENCLKNLIHLSIRKLETHGELSNIHIHSGYMFCVFHKRGGETKMYQENILFSGDEYQENILHASNFSKDANVQNPLIGTNFPYNMK